MALAAASPRRRDNPAPRSRGGGLKAIVLALRENAPGIHFFKTATRNQATVLATFGHQYCLCPPPPALCGLGPTGAQRSAPLLPPRPAWCGWTGKYVKTFACREIVLNNLKRCVRLYRPCMRSALQRHAYSSYFGRHCSWRHLAASTVWEGRESRSKKHINNPFNCACIDPSPSCGRHWN